MLLLEAGLFGTFTALNFFHWFLFWELSLIPAFFLIKLWGGPERSRAAPQFFLYTMVGECHDAAGLPGDVPGDRQLRLRELANLGRGGRLSSRPGGQPGLEHLTAGSLALVIWLGCCLGFAVKVPLVPFHTWLPTAYARRPRR